MTWTIKDSTLIKSADYMKLAVTADMLEYRVRIQNDLGKKFKKKSSVKIGLKFKRKQALLQSIRKGICTQIGLGKQQIFGKRCSLLLIIGVNADWLL